MGSQGGNIDVCLEGCGGLYGGAVLAGLSPGTSVGLVERNERVVGYSGLGGEAGPKRSLSGRGDSRSPPGLTAVSPAVKASVERLRGILGRSTPGKRRVCEDGWPKLAFSGRGESASSSPSSGESQRMKVLSDAPDDLSLTRWPRRRDPSLEELDVVVGASQKRECLTCWSPFWTTAGEMRVVLTWKATPLSSAVRSESSPVLGFFRLDLRG